MAVPLTIIMLFFLGALGVHFFDSFFGNTAIGHNRSINGLAAAGKLFALAVVVAISTPFSPLLSAHCISSWIYHYSVSGVLHNSSILEVIFKPSLTYFFGEITNQTFAYVGIGYIIYTVIVIIYDTD